MRIRGTVDDDGLGGTNRGDTIYGLAGDDSIWGGGGKDFIRGGPGFDIIDGGEGNDVIRGDAGDDILSGGDGVNHMRGGAGDDYLSDGGGYGDVMLGGAGDDTLSTVMISVGNAVPGGSGMSFTTSHGGDGADTFRTGFQQLNGTSVSHVLDFDPLEGDRFGLNVDGVDAFDFFDSNDDLRIDDADDAALMWQGSLHLIVGGDSLGFIGVDHLDFASLAI